MGVEFLEALCLKPCLHSDALTSQRNFSSYNSYLNYSFSSYLFLLHYFFPSLYSLESALSFETLTVCALKHFNSSR